VKTEKCTDCGKAFELGPGTYLGPEDPDDTSCHPGMEFVSYCELCCRKNGILLPRISGETMKKVLGGKWPDARGFGWDIVDHFRLKDGQWEPYNGFGEILPGPSLKLTAEVDHGLFGAIQASEEDIEKAREELAKPFVPKCSRCGDNGAYDVKETDSGSTGRVCSCEAGKLFSNSLTDWEEF